MREIEILVEVFEKKEDALKILGGFNFVGMKNIIDTYFYDPLRNDFKPDKNGRLKKCLRIREKDRMGYLTYKFDHFDHNNTWIYSDEHELKISDLDTATKILSDIGMEILVKIENKKYTFTSDKYEIVLEDVKDLGLFMEVEYLNPPTDANVDHLKEEIRKFIKTLHIKTSEELNAGKPELALKKKNIGLLKL